MDGSWVIDLLVATAFNLPLAAASVRIAGTLAPHRGLSGRLQRSILIHLASAVLLVTVLGAAGFARPLPLFSASVVLFLLSRLLHRSVIGTPPAAVTIGEACVLGLLGALVVGGTVTGAGLFPWAWDVLTYHLPIPARWYQEGRLILVPVLHGDPSPTYAPANLEAWVLWLLQPAGAITAAKMAQLPFLALGGLSLYRICRWIGADRPSSLVALALAAANALVLRQAFTAENDLAMACCFVTALAFLVEHRTARSPGSLPLAGAAFGFLLGTKYLALTLAPFLLVALAWVLRGTRRAIGRVAAFTVPAALLSLFWYVRTWVVTGNPLFPLDVSLAGMRLFDGVFSREAMTASPFHVAAGFIPVVVLHAFRPGLLLLAAVGVVACLARRESGGEQGVCLLIAPLPVALAAWHFLIVPYNGQYRFLLPAVLACVPAVARVIGLPGAMGNAFRLIAGTTLAVSLLGIPGSWPGGAALGVVADPFSHLAPLLDDRLLVPGRAWPFLALAAALAAAAFRVLGGRRRRAGAALALAAAGLLAVLAPPLMVLMADTRRDLPVNAFLAMARLSGGRAVIANAGNNVPFPLFGPRLGNRVVPVPITGLPGDLWHEFARALWERGVVPGGLPADLPLDGVAPDRSAWLRRLERTGASFLFVTAIRRETAAWWGYPHDDEGFGAERRWAEELPERFVPVHRSGPGADRAAVIYRIVPAPASEGGVSGREPISALTDGAASPDGSSSR